MASFMPKDEEEKFRIFLEENVFKQSFSSFRQFRGGMCSYSFFAEIKNTKLVIKFLLNKLITSDVHVFLQSHIEEALPLRGIKMDNIIYYHDSVVTIQQYYGTVLPQYKIKQELLNNIFLQYNKFLQLSACCPCDKNFNVYTVFGSYQGLKERIMVNKSFRAKLVKYFLDKISSDKLIYDINKLVYIHGDFHNKQILVQDGELSAFIDWDSLRPGYAAEDYWKFCYSNLQYHYEPISLYFGAKRFLDTALEYADQTTDEWKFAINSYLLSQLERVFDKFKIRRFIRFLYLYVLSKMMLRKVDKA